MSLGEEYLVDLEDKPDGPAQAEAALGALEGPDALGMTQPQRISVQERFKGLFPLVAEVSFDKGYYKSDCCRELCLKISGYRKRIEGFKRQVIAAANKEFCPNCGEFRI